MTSNETSETTISDASVTPGPLGDTMVSTLASKLDGLIMSTSSPPHIDNWVEESLLADIEHYPTHDLKFLC